jgi:hypothetical protein
LIAATRNVYAVPLERPVTTEDAASVMPSEKEVHEAPSVENWTA